MTIAHVVVDVPARSIDTPFDYRVPAELAGVDIGSCVLVDFGSRPVVGYVVGIAATSSHPDPKPITALLGVGFFDAVSVQTASWIATRYLSPLSESLRLFLPPGGTPRVSRSADGTWQLLPPTTRPVDDRWASRTPQADAFVPAANATTQRAILDALSEGPLRVSELSADLGAVDSALKRLEALGAVTIERRRRMREPQRHTAHAARPDALTNAQADALAAITHADAAGNVIVLHGVTGSGKTEVYLQAIEHMLSAGRGALVLVPEISLTPQTVGRFRSRFADDVAVLHSRLSAGERFDQWDRVRTGEARVVVGARSALFAPVRDLGLIVIDEEHENTYKQGSSPRYHARDVAVTLAAARAATVVLGSATPSLETLHKCSSGGWKLAELPDRVPGRTLPKVTVVDMAQEFSDGHRSMFSRHLTEVLAEVREAGEKAVLLLNRRGFASFLLCRECGHVPKCDQCATSMTFHEVGSRLTCHHCGATRPVPPTCPQCDSAYLRRFGAGTQRVETELAALMPGWPIVRMDADTTSRKGGHERALAAFEGLDSGVLLGTQMIAKGLDYPEVTAVGVVNADTTLNIPDFRSAERTYQLLEQVAGRAGRGERPGRVIIQTYWPDHPAITAVAAHDPDEFYRNERAEREALGYPPFGRLVNILVRSRSLEDVKVLAGSVAASLHSNLAEGWSVLGPSPCALSRLKGVHRWHLLVKAPSAAHVEDGVAKALALVQTRPGVTVAVDIDPVDLL